MSMPRCRAGRLSGRMLLPLLAVALIGAVPGIGTARAAAAHPVAARSTSAGCDQTPSVGDRSLPRETSGADRRQEPVRLPRDEAPHHEPNEWWYFSGHLWGVDPAGGLHCYGFEYVTFQFLNIAPGPVYVGNVAITDLSRHSFHYGAQQDSYPVPNTPGGFDLHAGAWTMRGRLGHDVLHASLPGYTMALTLQSTKPPVLHGTNGVINYGPFGTSKYYSWTALLAGGTVVDHGTPVRVLGTSWMDHQWGAFNFASGAGWDWFSVQLSNGEQYMLYFIRDRRGRIVQTAATRVDRLGHGVGLASATVSERATGMWRSPATGITYSSGWRLRVPHGELVITPSLKDQELDLRRIQGVVYWEGAVSVGGTINHRPVIGVGYTEINPPDQA